MIERSSNIVLWIPAMPWAEKTGLKVDSTTKKIKKREKADRQREWGQY